MPITDKPELVSWLINSKGAAEFLNVSEGTLAIWRCTRRYDLPFVKVGHAIRYDLRDLNDFIDRRKVRQRKPR